MSRVARNDMKNSSFFHIMVQGINREYIFETQKEKEKYIQLIEKNQENVDILAYCIMDNHAHILAKVDKLSDLEACMRKTNTGYAIYYNKKINRVGYVFRDRYKLQSIKDAKHLFLCIEYIHNNPVKAGICKNKGEYKFSSFTKIYEKDMTKIHKKIEKMVNQQTIKTNDIYDENDKLEFIEDQKEKETKDEICRNIIFDFAKKESIDIRFIKEDTDNLKKLVDVLHNKNKISYKMMEEYLNVSREKLRKLNISDDQPKKQ